MFDNKIDISPISLNFIDSSNKNTYFIHNETEQFKNILDDNVRVFIIKYLDNLSLEIFQNNMITFWNYFIDYKFLDGLVKILSLIDKYDLYSGYITNDEADSPENIYISIMNLKISFIESVISMIVMQQKLG